jgi:hypothetical protein
MCWHLKELDHSSTGRRRSCAGQCTSVGVAWWRGRLCSAWRDAFFLRAIYTELSYTVCWASLGGCCNNNPPLDWGIGHCQRLGCEYQTTGIMYSAAMIVSIKHLGIHLHYSMNIFTSRQTHK